MKKKLLILIVTGIVSYFCGHVIARNGPSPGGDQQEERSMNHNRAANRSKLAGGKEKKNTDDDYVRKVRKMNSVQKKEELLRLIEKGRDVHWDMGILLEEWGKVAPREALEELRKTGGKFQFQQQNIFRGWASKDPEGSAAYYMDHRESLYSAKVIYQIIAKWTALDPDSAWKWLSEKDVTEQKNTLPVFLQTIKMKYPDKFGDYLLLLPPYDLTDDWTMKQTLSGWMDADMEAAKKHLEQLSHEQKKAMALTLFEIHLEKDPDKAIEYADLIDFSQTPWFFTYKKTLFKTLGEEQGMNWFIKHLPEKNVDLLINNNSLSFTSVDACISWAKNREESPLRTKLISSFVGKNSTRDYAGAMGLIDQLSETAEKDTLKKQNLMYWAEFDKDAAWEWVDSNSFSDQDKQRLAKKIREQGIFKQ